MSDVAVQYVKGLKKSRMGPDKKPLSTGELRVLGALAALHNEYVWCAFPYLRTLAEMALMSQSHCRRMIEGLVERNVLRRYFCTSDRWGETTSNEYEFVGLGHAEVTQETRDVVFRCKRTRSAVQLSLRRGGRQRKGAGSTSGEQSDQGSNECAVDADLVVEMPVDGVAGGTHESCGGHSPRLPVEFVREFSHDGITPVVPTSAQAAVDSRAVGPQTFAEAYLGIGKARTTASAKATTKTSSLRSPAVSMEGAGKAGMSPGPRVVEFRPRREPRDLDQAMALLSPEEQLELSIAVDVLEACGIPREACTRGQRNAVLSQLRLESRTTGQALALVAAAGVAAWEEYRDAARGGFLFRSIGPKEFFANGYWLDASRWDWDKRELRERRRPQF